MVLLAEESMRASVASRMDLLGGSDGRDMPGTDDDDCVLFCNSTLFKLYSPPLRFMFMYLAIRRLFQVEHKTKAPLPFPQH